MPHIRTVKPDFFTDWDLCSLSPLHRLLFQGLWCHADREGRLLDRPRELKVKILPYDDCDVETMLSTLAPRFIVRYSVNGSNYIQVRNFVKHQRIKTNEAESILPAPEDNLVTICPPSGGQQDDSSGSGREGKGREGKGREVVASDQTPALDPALVAILADCPHLSLVSTAESAAFWDQVLGACEPYPLADGRWLGAKLRAWETWFKSNSSRRSRDRKRLEARLMGWLGKDLEQLARRKSSIP